tara:strand:+ start:241 stop:507 length:267 start_codon:yes stop_codon:yes gene_type:complete
MKRITTNKVKTYMASRSDQKLRQNPEHIAIACNEACYEFDHDNALDMLKLLCFNDPIVELHTHSYSFHTATGRHIVDTIKEYYYEQKQ